jgi:hypothetical protein
MLKQLTCRFNGIYFDLDDITIESMFLDQARGFYDYLIQNNAINYIKWSSTYDDRLGLGKILTATKAIFRTERNFLRLIGVAGIDVLVSQIDDHLNST